MLVPVKSTFYFIFIFIFLLHFLIVHGDEDATCEQRTEDGKCCVFPFTYEGQETYFCTRGGPSDLYWCATTNNYDLDGEWGICSGKHKIALYSFKVILSEIFLHICRWKVEFLLKTRHWFTGQGNKYPLWNTSSPAPEVDIRDVVFLKELVPSMINSSVSRLQEKSAWRNSQTFFWTTTSLYSQITS